MIPINNCEKIKIPQGFFYLGPSTKESSKGYLELNPKQSLVIHNRPTGIERLTQIKGISSMIVYDIPDGRIVTLHKNDTLEINPPGTWHIHSNPYENISLTYWDFEGDIRYIIEAIRNTQ